MHLADPIRLQVPDQIINNIVQAYNFCTAAPRMHICYANAHTSGSSVHQKQPEVLIEPLVSNFLSVWATRYVDGRQYASAQNSRVNPAGGWFTSAAPPTACGPPFDQPFRILLNVAVGGLLPGRAPSKDTVFPQTMLVRSKPP